MISIRQVEPAEERTAALLRRLQLEILPSDIPASTETGWWWIATNEKGQAVAFSGLGMSSRWSDAVYLCRAGVLHTARGQGLQKRMIRVRENKARALGMRWLVTDTTDNPASANSLITCGFRMFTPSAPWGNPTACYWRKEIQQ